MFALLLRHTVFSGDVRALVQAVHAGYVTNDTVRANGRQFVVEAEMSAVDPAELISVPMLTREQRAALNGAPVPSPQQLRVAQAIALSLLGTDARVNDTQLARIAEAQHAFAPDAVCALFEYTPGVMAVMRSVPTGQRVMCLANATAEEQLVPVPWRKVLGSANVRDLIGGARLAVHGPSFALGPHDVRWLI